MDGPELFKAYERFKERAQFYRGHAYHLEAELRTARPQLYRADQRIDRLEQYVQRWLAPFQTRSDPLSPRVMAREERLTTRSLQAVYEKGVLRPLEPLPLKEPQRVTVSDQKVGDWLDATFPRYLEA